MSRKNQRNRVDSNLVSIASRMSSEILSKEGTPILMVGIKATETEGYLEHLIAVNPALTRAELLHFLRRTVGLIEGSIPERFPSETN